MFKSAPEPSVDTCPPRTILGGEYKQLSSGQDINDLTEGMYFSFSTAVIQSLLHGPGTTDQEIIIESHPRIKNNPYGYQLYYWIHEGRIWIRHYHNLQGWSSWVEIATGLPSFYKNYATFQGLVSAITGDIKWDGTTHLPADADNSIDVSTLGCGLYTVTHGRKIIGHPSEISSQVTLIIRTTYSSPDKSTILIPIEAGTGVGIWAKYKDSIASFAKVV